MRKLVSILSLILCVSLCHAQTTWSVSNTGTTSGERLVATLDAGTFGSYVGITLTGTVADYSGNWGYASPVIADFSLYIRYSATSSYELIQSQKTKNVILRLRQVSASVYNLTANCTANERLSINYSVQFGAAVTVTPGDAATLNSTGTLVVSEPTYLLREIDNGVSLNSIATTNPGLSVMSYTGGRNTTTGAQLEFITPANTDGSNMFGQGRIITVAGNTNNSDATGKMILGTKRSFNKLGTGNQWYYGDDITIDGAGYVGIGTTTPTVKLEVNGSMKSSLMALSEASGNIGYLARGGLITSGWSATPDILALTYYQRDFAIGGWRKSDGLWQGASLFINSDNGYVGIGTTTPGYKLAVAGTVAAQTVKVTQSGWADYVFDENYKLASLSEVENYINQNKHLPDVPSAKEVIANGIDLGDNQAILLKKIEELTLYLIEIKKENEALRKRVDTLENKK